MKIIFEFVGGPKDGTVLEGKLGEPSDAERFYLFSNRGTVGHRFKVASSYAVDTLAEERLKKDKRHHFQQHHYDVIERLEEEDEVHVRARYMPQAPESDIDSPE